jgi:hypothetical protein
MLHARQRHRTFGKLTGVAAIAVALGAASAAAQQPASIAAPVPFPMTLSNTTPLVFGMDAETATRALGATLYYVNGRPGDEVWLAFRTHGGSGLLPRQDRLYLQFRDGRLTGWKGDWGRSWMWR